MSYESAVRGCQSKATPRLCQYSCCRADEVVAVSVCCRGSVIGPLCPDTVTLPSRVQTFIHTHTHTHTHSNTHTHPAYRHTNTHTTSPIPHTHTHTHTHTRSQRHASCLFHSIRDTRVHLSPVGGLLYKPGSRVSPALNAKGERCLGS